MIAIQAVQLGKSYGHFRILEGISFELSASVCFVLLGPNGAGKTTLVKILATLTRPSAGQFRILGFDGVREKEKFRHSVILLGHGSHLYDDLNAIENLRFSMGMRGETITDRQIKLALDKVEIGAYREMKIRNFSAGMKKRLSLAKAFLSLPKILLLDEPYNTLDDTGTQIMNGFIQDIVKQGGTVLMTTHDRMKAAQVAHQAGILDKGIMHPLNLEDLKTNGLS